MDAALDAMRDARDDAEFTRALRQFESAFEDDPPAVLLTWNETIQAVSHRFVVPHEADGRDAMHFISRWHAAAAGPGAADEDAARPLRRHAGDGRRRSRC